ncbi:MAG: cysteine--tRNA ligase [Candidatus Brocadiia bacterium]
MLKVFNTLGNRIEPFEPLHPPRVGMYVCGVTVYNTVHVGHARCYVSFDLIRRYLTYRGYDVTTAQNFTDIDDKIIDRAQRENRDWRELTVFYTAEYFRMMDALGIRRADHYPRASEFIPRMLEIVETLVRKGHAYVTPSGDVYFEVATFPEYGALVAKSRLDSDTVSRVASSDEKRSHNDFALWKSAKPGEPSWDSPWGKGRPGWHIECSAMSGFYLGETFDIHGGGQDLIFPHHTNEIAQSQCFTGRPMARYWMHNGFINIDDEKMSKSLGNFITLEDALPRWGAAALRMFFLRTHYRSPQNFDADMLNESKAALGRLNEAVADAHVLLDNLPHSDCEPNKAGKKLAASMETAEGRFQEAMDDDFNSSAGLAVLFELAQDVFGYVKTGAVPKAPGVNTQLLADGVALLEKLLSVIGFYRGEVEYNHAALADALIAAGHDPLGADPLAFALARRYSLRNTRDFAAADVVRDTIMKTTGLPVKDWPFGSTASLQALVVEKITPLEEKR